MSLRRWVRAGAFALFLALVSGAYFAGSAWAVDVFLGLDPFLAVVTVLATGALSMAALPGLVVLASALVAGRAFCSWVCPLGATLDCTDLLVRRGKRAKAVPSRPWALAVLVFIVAGALLGVSLAFAASPLSLAMRFYGLLAAPLSALGLDAALHLAAPALKDAGLRSLAFAEVPLKVFASQWFILGFFALVVGLGRAAPRFWCRNLCPAGALLGLFSFRPLARRRVSDACTDCGACARACPMGAIDPERPRDTARFLCLECARCQEVCPQGAVRFLAGLGTGGAAVFSPTRRALMASALGGAGTVALASALPLPATAAEQGVLRPPGALPEQDFLAACVRCGACMAACPTNTLQPLWFSSGVLGLFSPSQAYGLGACEPACHSCADVCPTRALRRVGPKDRLFAKLGTAVIVKDKCLAWKNEKKCLVCDEVCPYDAVAFKHDPEHGDIMVPEVEAEKCAGCGYCQKHCPAKDKDKGKAIVVLPQGALRPGRGSLEAAARGADLKLAYKPKGQGVYAPPPSVPAGPAPGFTD